MRDYAAVTGSPVQWEFGSLKKGRDWAPKERRFATAVGAYKAPFLVCRYLTTTDEVPARP